MLATVLHVAGLRCRLSRSFQVLIIRKDRHGIILLDTARLFGFIAVVFIQMMLYIAHHLFLLVLATALFGRSSAFDTVFKADRTAAQREARTTWVAKVNQMWSYPTGFLYRVSDVYFPVRFRQLEGKCANYNYLTKSLTTIDDCRLAEDQWRWKMVTYNGNSCTALEVVKKDRTGTGDCLRNDGKAVVPCSKRGAGEPAFDCAINSHYLIFALTLMPLCEGLNTDWSDTKKETCVDIDECREKGATCPSNSDCVNTQGDYSCRCKDGYINKDTKAAGAVSKTGTCEKGLTFTSASDVTTAGFKMAVASGGPINGTMTLNLYQAANEVEGFEIAVPTFSNSPVLFTSTGVTKKPMLFDNLKPGTKYEVKLNDITSDQVTTKCHCEAVGGDETGKPTGLQATQDNGFVTFAFTDNSLCEEGYGFYRKDLANSEEAFAPDYYYTSKQTCNNRAQYSPGLQAADDLHRSKLTVGQTYTYGVRAIARQSWRQSTYAEVSHKVLWEASVDGRVTLKPAAGSLPVERVTVEYRLEDLDHKAVPVCDEQLARKSAGNDLGWCTVESTKSGRFAINLSSKDDSDGLLTVGANPNIQEFPLHMRFRKTTGAIHHGFLCNDLLCSAPPDTSVNIFTTDEHSEMEGVETVYLRHLEFDHPVHVIDDTSVPFRGKITIKGTEGPGAALLGCPIGGAKVCLVDHTSRNDKAEEQTCVETDGDGFYELPAVYGSKISPVVKYHGHEFEAVNANHVEKFKKGIIIDPDTTYEGYNLRDVTTALMTVEVAGGLCNRVLGTSKIKVELPGCDWGWGGQILEQDGFSQVYSVVAHTVKLSLTEITGPDKDGNTIDKTPVVEDVTLDLRDVEDDVQVGNETGRNNLQEVGASGSNETDEALQKDEDDENRVLRKKLARFQYDGTDVITVTMATINGTEETTAGCKPPKPNGVDTYSYHVLPTWKLFSLTAVFRQDFGYGIDSCDKYPEGTTISIQNYLGIAKTGDEEWFAKYNKPQYAKEIKALQACQPSCTKAIEGNTVDVLFITGQPNPFGGMTKSLFITKSDKIHRADVVVTGDYELPGGFSVALPTHKPLLVLRDPPGKSLHCCISRSLSFVV